MGPTMNTSISSFSGASGAYVLIMLVYPQHTEPHRTTHNIVPRIPSPNAMLPTTIMPSCEILIHHHSLTSPV
ncbi:hypothetical protein VTJ04DRAFT_7430 [Mycothermus thermophilus]|uniref:uncharacterized protein n=1 Tax=Humicola insolens TaxID=85995 RepID=UPI0037426ACC